MILLRASLSSVPETSNHDAVPPVINPVVDDVSAGPERHDQLAIAGARCRASPFRRVGEGIGCRKQRVDRSLREGITMGRQELSEPLEIGPRTGQEDDLHGAGGGNSSLVPQLLTHSSTAAIGMASPVRSYSA